MRRPERNGCTKRNRDDPFLNGGEMIPLLPVLHRTIDACRMQKEIAVKIFENATSLLLALAAQALAVGIVFAH
jgi:hypothetical protein